MEQTHCHRPDCGAHRPPGGHRSRAHRYRCRVHRSPLPRAHPDRVLVPAACGIPRDTGRGAHIVATYIVGHVGDARACGDAHRFPTSSVSFEVRPADRRNFSAGEPGRLHAIEQEEVIASCRVGFGYPLRGGHASATRAIPRSPASPPSLIRETCAEGGGSARRLGSPAVEPFRACRARCGCPMDGRGRSGISATRRLFGARKAARRR